MSSRGLLISQALVAVITIAVWHIGSSVPLGGVYVLPKFFFSTPIDVARRAHLEEAFAAPARSSTARSGSTSPACSASPTLVSARPCGNI